MADIEGIVTTEQLDSLMDAGYHVTAQPDENGLHRVSVFVNADVNELLSPPLCANCGALMHHNYFPDQEGGTSLYVCPDCGEQVRIVVDVEGK